MFEVSNYKDISIAMNLNTNMGANIKVFLYVIDGLLVDCGPQIMEEDVDEGIFRCTRTVPLPKSSYLFWAVPLKESRHSINIKYFFINSPLNS